MKQRLLTWFLTPPYLVLFVGTLLLFQPLLIAGRAMGWRCYQWIFFLMNGALVNNFRFVGTKMSVQFKTQLPENRPIIFVSNHQSMYDVPFMIWHLRRYTPLFIAKLELGKWVPSISYALRHGGHILINRSDARQSLREIEEFGRYVEDHRYSACLFPEGTRGRAGKMRIFKTSGFEALLQNMPTALVVPVAINGSWKMLEHNLWPIPFGVALSLTVFHPIEPRGQPPRKLLSEIEKLIRSSVEGASNTANGGSPVDTDVGNLTPDTPANENGDGSV